MAGSKHCRVWLLRKFDLAADQSHNPMVILLVEDDEDQLAVREMLVAQFGFEVLSASTVEAALAAARRGAPDYALIDLRLPFVCVGLVFLCWLLQMQPSLRISVLTGMRAGSLERLPERVLIEEIHEKGRSSLPDLLARLRAEQSSVTH